MSKLLPNLALTGSVHCGGDAPAFGVHHQLAANLAGQGLRVELPSLCWTAVVSHTAFGPLTLKMAASLSHQLNAPSASRGRRGV